MLANSVSAALGLGSEKDGERTERLSSRSCKPHCSGIPTSDQHTQRPQTNGLSKRNKGKAPSSRVSSTSPNMLHHHQLYGPSGDDKAQSTSAATTSRAMQCLCMEKGIQAKGGQTTIPASLAPGDVEVQLRAAQARRTPLHADTGVLTARFYRRLPRSKRAAKKSCLPSNLQYSRLLLLLLLPTATATVAAASPREYRLSCCH